MTRRCAQVSTAYTMNPRAARLAERMLPFLLLLAGVAAFLGETWRELPQIDDAYISYRYARNLVEGHGLVFNPGERVEGYTNLLWTLLVALGLALGSSAELAGRSLGLLSGIGALVATYVYARDGLAPSRAWIAAVPVAIVVSFTGFVYWPISGMETPMFVAAVTFALAAHVRNRLGWTTLAVGIATLTRPEGALLAGIVFTHHLATSRGDGWRRWRWPCVYAFLLAMLTAFRLGYYGSLLPNTFYAKVGGIPMQLGVKYVRDFLESGAIWLLPPAAIAALGDRRWRIGAIYVLATAAYVIVIGGDAFPYSRFLLPAFPCLAVLAVRGAEVTWRMHAYSGIAVSLAIPVAISWQVFGGIPGPLLFCIAALAVACILTVWLRRAWIVAAAALAVGVALTVPLPDSASGFESIRESLRNSKQNQALALTTQRNRFQFVRALRAGNILVQERPRPRLVASGGIGAIGYYSRLPMLDLFGITDPTIARSRSKAIERAWLLPGHHRSNADYVFSRRPDVLLIPQAGTPVRLPAILEIWEHPDFKAHYAWDPHLEGYRRKGAAPSTPSTSAREGAAGAARSTAPRPSTPTAATSATTRE